jgi:hypothetical protein
VTVEPTAYFRFKIEGRLSFLEERAWKIDAGYREQVERLARRAPDEVWARFFRDTMKPRNILSATARIRTLLGLDLVEADQELRRLVGAIHYVDSLLTRPYFDAGFKTMEGGRRAALRRHGTAAEQAVKGQKICDAFDRNRANGKSIGQAQKAVAKAFGITPRTAEPICAKIFLARPPSFQQSRSMVAHVCSHTRRVVNVRVGAIQATAGARRKDQRLFAVNNLRDRPATQRGVGQS